MVRPDGKKETEMSDITSMQEPAEIRELSSAEIDAVTGAGFWEAVSVLLISIGLAIGVTTAAHGHYGRVWT
jgi:hypothetical protein